MRVRVACGVCTAFAVLVLAWGVRAAEEPSASAAKPAAGPAGSATSPGTLAASAAPSSADASADVDLRRLRAELDRLKALVDEHAKALRSQSQDISKILYLVEDQNKQLAKVYEEYQRLADRLDAQLKEQRARLEQIAEQDKAGNYVPAIRANMAKSPEFREAMTAVVHEAMRREGILRVQNQTGVGVYLRVNNDKLYYIAPYSTHPDISVPVGTLTTELVGYEPPKNWTIGAPHYFQQINITPGAARLVEPAVVALPTVWTPLRYVW